VVGEVVIINKHRQRVDLAAADQMVTQVHWLVAQEQLDKGMQEAQPRAVPVILVAVVVAQAE
jgi:GTPase